MEVAAAGHEKLFLLGFRLEIFDLLGAVLRMPDLDAVESLFDKLVQKLEAVILTRVSQDRYSLGFVDSLDYLRRIGIIRFI